MKHKPQTFTHRAAAILLAVSAAAAILSQISPVLLHAQEAGDARQAPEPAPAAATPPKLRRSQLSSAQVFEQVAEALDAADTLSCRIDQDVVLSGHRFHAAGRYTQASGNRMRLEYRIFPVRAVKATDEQQAAIDAGPADTSELTETGSLLQVSDGSVLWSYWVNGTQKQLTRRNIGEIIDAVDEIPNYSAATSLQDLGAGGLQTLMSQLQTGMEFGAVQEQRVGNVDMLVLYGRWNEKTRKDVFQIADNPDAVLPEYIPDYVRVYVTAESMLPRRVQYLKKYPDPEVKQIRPIVTLDLRDIKPNEEVAGETFEFQRPADLTVQEVDLTSQVIDGIKRAAAPPEEAAAEPAADDAEK